MTAKSKTEKSSSKSLKSAFHFDASVTKDSSSSSELTWLQVNQWVSKLVRKTKTFKPDFVIGIAHGGVFVGNGLAASLKLPFFPVRISKRTRDAAHLKSGRMQSVVPKEVKGMRVLIVDDVSKSGETLQLAKKLTLAAGASDAKTVCLVSRPSGYAPDFEVERSEQFYVFPWDLAEIAIDARVLV